MPVVRALQERGFLKNTPTTFTEHNEQTISLPFTDSSRNLKRSRRREEPPLSLLQDKGFSCFRCAEAPHFTLRIQSYGI